jgi:hypothetical protein
MTGNGVTGGSAGVVLVQPRSVPLRLPGPLPASWGPAGVPPGVPFATAGGEVVSAGSNVPSAGPSFAGPCVAVSPSPPTPPPLPNGCVGHDEPSVSFYSDALGSGGNVTWNVTLPQDQSPTANQSDLYAAAWFGLVVSDPAGWLGQCYVEVQLYPDFNWSDPSTTVSGDWSGAVVGWQVNPVSGDIDTCFYAPLTVSGHAGVYFAMSQGDNLSLRLNGWLKDATGENVTLTDTTRNVSASVNLFNQTGNFPLDPAYPTNSFSSSLLWTSGGQLPVSFGFEIGRSGHPGGVTDNGFGGCNPGAGGPKPANPAVPCPSYDPLSWVNDTSSPWQIDVPQFYTSGGHTTPAQVSFSSTVGASILSLSNNTCLNRIGGSYCTYPWFGYSCTQGGFTIGATSFPGESNTFGQWSQYPSLASQNILGFPTYSPTNFSIPNCSGSGDSVTFSTAGGVGGTIDFLSQVGSSFSAHALTPGMYSLAAISPAGDGFAGWTETGSVAVGTASSPWTNLRVSGSGTVTADFTASPHRTAVWFNSTAVGSAVVVTPGQFFTNSTTPITVPTGTAVSLAPGIYGIQAAPPSGSTFARWTVVTDITGAALASPTSPVSWIVVTGATATVGIVVTYMTTVGQTVTVQLAGFGSGAVSLDGQSTGAYNAVTGYSNATVTLGPGTYAANATAAPGWAFLGWTYTISASLVNFSSSTTVTFVSGTATLVANFGAEVTTLVAPANAGAVAFNGLGPLLNNTTTIVLRGLYTLNALPVGYQKFQSWQVSNPANLSVALPSYALTHVLVNGPGSISVIYASAVNVSITFDNLPAAGGSIVFNYNTISGASTVNQSLTTGAYLLRGVANAGWEINATTPFSLTGPVSSASGSGILTVSGPGGVVTANWVQIGYPVSFVTGSGANVTALFGGQVTPLPSGGTLSLAAATYTLSAIVGPDATFARWVGTINVDPQNDLAANTNVTVRGPGTLFAVTDAFALGVITATPPTTDAHHSVTFDAAVYGTPVNPLSWRGLPVGCVSHPVNPLTCTPTANGVSSVTLTTLGSFGLPVTSPALSFTVGPGPQITGFTASRNVVDLGMSVTLTTTVSGGTAPLSYRYAPLPTGCTSANTSTLVCAPTGTGNTTVEVTVTDGAGISLYANQTLSVYPALALVSVSASRSTVTASVPFQFTVATTGGSPTLVFTYVGLPTSCASASTATFSCTPSISGTYTVNATVTDGAGATANGSAVVVVNPLPSISGFTSSSTEFPAGTSVTFTVTASGGTGPLTYVYGNLPGGCTSTNASTLTCAPNATGTFTVNVTVSDSFGVKGAPATTIVAVLPANTSNGSSSGISWWLWVLIAVIILVVIIGLLLWWRRSPPPTTAGTSNPPATAPSDTPSQQWDEQGGGPP